jgi:hypothetical protein
MTLLSTPGPVLPSQKPDYYDKLVHMYIVQPWHSYVYVESMQNTY